MHGNFCRISGTEFADMMNKMSHSTVEYYNSTVEWQRILDPFIFGEDDLKYYFGNEDEENFEVSVFKENISISKDSAEDSIHITIDFNNGDKFLITSNKL